MSALVEGLVADPAQLSRMLSAISTFVKAPNNESALRTAIMKIAKTNQGEHSWSFVTKKFVKLFPPQVFPIDNFNDTNTIKRFALDLHESRNRDLGSYLMLFVAAEFERDDGSTYAHLRHTDSKIFELCGSIYRYIKTKNVSDLYQTASRVAGIQAISSVASALQDSSDSNRTHRFLFSASEVFEDQGTTDASYYAVYRYSTRRNEIVKTFVAIQTPALSPAGCFQFTHVYPLELKGHKRVAHGPILAYDHCLHFVGATNTVIKGKISRNLGVKIMTVPMGAQNSQHRLLTGVFLSHNLAWQPVVGRFALVHLGYLSELGAKITDDDLSTGRIADEDELFDDLSRMDEKYKVSTYKTIKDVQDFIIEHINNVPFVDRSLPSAEIGFRSIMMEDGREPLD